MYCVHTTRIFTVLELFGYLVMTVARDVAWAVWLLHGIVTYIAAAVSLMHAYDQMETRSTMLMYVCISE